MGTIFLFLAALALLGKLIPGKGFQYFRVYLVFGVKVDDIYYQHLEREMMKSKSLIAFYEQKCCLFRSLWDLSNHCAFEYETPHLSDKQLSGFWIYPRGWAQRVGSMLLVVGGIVPNLIILFCSIYILWYSEKIKERNIYFWHIYFLRLLFSLNFTYSREKILVSPREKFRYFFFFYPWQIKRYLKFSMLFQIKYLNLKSNIKNTKFFTKFSIKCQVWLEQYRFYMNSY